MSGKGARRLGTVEGAAGLDLWMLDVFGQRQGKAYGEVECDFGGLLLDFGVEALFLVRAQLVCQGCRGDVCGEDAQNAEQW